jgi:hypothetical protein
MRPDNSLKPWKITRIPVRSSGTNGLRLTPREERRGPSAGGLADRVGRLARWRARQWVGVCPLPPGSLARGRWAATPCTPRYDVPLASLTSGAAPPWINDQLPITPHER